MSGDPLQDLIHEGIAVVPIGVLEPETYNGIFELFARFYKLGREHGAEPKDPCGDQLADWTCSLPSGPHPDWKHCDETEGAWWTQARPV